MSHVTHPRVPIRSRKGPARVAWAAALLALAALTTIALVIALSGGSSPDATAVGAQAQPGLRADGGPDETRVATALAGRRAAAPSESVVAAAIGRASTPVAQRPDESRVAAAIAAR